MAIPSQSKTGFYITLGVLAALVLFHYIERKLP